MTLYLDTRSLVELYVAEPGSDAVRTLVNAASIVATSTVAYTETRAALARRRRERALRPKAFASAEKTFEAEWPRYFTVDVTSAVCRQAGDFAERYRLRAYDSVHLAAFAEVAREAGLQDTRFSSFDYALNRAATLASLDAGSHSMTHIESVYRPGAVVRTTADRRVSRGPRRSSGGHGFTITLPLDDVAPDAYGSISRRASHASARIRRG